MADQLHLCVNLFCFLILFEEGTAKIITIMCSTKINKLKNAFFFYSSFNLVFKVTADYAIYPNIPLISHNYDTVQEDVTLIYLSSTEQQQLSLSLRDRYQIAYAYGRVAHFFT